jgi:hypothetical protein
VQEVRRDHKVLSMEYHRSLQKLREEIPGSVFEEFVTD